MGFTANYASPTVSVPPVSQGEVDLAYQVGRLSEEIQQLRQQQAVSSYTQRCLRRRPHRNSEARLFSCFVMAVVWKFRITRSSDKHFGFSRREWRPKFPFPIWISMRLNRQIAVAASGFPCQRNERREASARRRSPEVCAPSLLNPS